MQRCLCLTVTDVKSKTSLSLTIMRVESQCIGVLTNVEFETQISDVTNCHGRSEIQNDFANDLLKPRSLMPK